MNLYDTLSLDSVIGTMGVIGYVVYPESERVNIIGVRSSDKTPNVFNDVLTLVWNNRGTIYFEKFKATTDPGLYWMKNPENVDGVAILVPMQYVDGYKIGLHKGYSALVQNKPVKVYRDLNRDESFDLDTATIHTGFFGINIHRANAEQESVAVNKWSAGCQVIANPSAFERFMYVCNRSREIHGNRFTYTLLNESALV